MSTSIKSSVLRRKILLDTFHPSSFWLKTLKISSTWNGKTCSTAATLARHLLALGTAAVFSFFIILTELGSREPTCPYHLCQ